MQKKELSPDLIAEVLKENLGKENVRFVFATDVALNSWAEYAVKNPDISGTNAVAMEQFAAWDKFKEKFVVAEEEGKHAVPSLLRKIFVYNLIAENAEAVQKGEPLFHSIINPQFADEAYSFADWISGNLSSLKQWNESLAKWLEKNPGSELDDEDRDYLELYKRYSEFLGDSMFEPSWVKPDFEETELNFIIFFPEQMEDFSEYEELLYAAKNVTVYVLPEKHEKQKIYEYSDARLELRRTALKIRSLVEESNGKIHWDDISVHVPQLETYRPYIKREFENYCIPFVIRKGNPYTVNSAGSLFRQIQDCFNSSYSYDSVRALLLNSYIPWKDKDVNERLVREGNRLHCLCSYDKGESNDVWIKALSAVPQDERELCLYRSLRTAIGGMCNAGSFKAIEDSWFKFKQQFLKEDEFTEGADNILSRCVALLQELIDLEEDFVKPMNLKITSPYSFFLNELNGKSYRPQETITGVSVFDYKLAACSACRYNFVLNCTQSAVSVTYRPVSFLNNIKRQKLNFIDSDFATEAFIRLYGKFNSDTETCTWFSSSTDGFAGFAIPNNCLEKAGDNPFEELDEKDFYLNEKNWIMKNGKVPDVLLAKQKQQFIQWQSTADFLASEKNTDKKTDADSEVTLSTELKKRIEFSVKEKRSSVKNIPENLTGIERENSLIQKDSSVMKITQSDLKSFFPCPRKWLLKSVLNLKDDSLDLQLLDSFDQGNILHKMLELYAADISELPVAKNGSFDEETECLTRSVIAEDFKKAIHDYSLGLKEMPLVMEALESQQEKFTDILMKFLHDFCSEENYGGYKVYKTESWFCGKDAESSYALSGKIDCILSSPEDDGSYFIIDYKTGNVPAISSSNVDDKGKLKDFQSAHYIKLWKLNEKTENTLRQMSFRKIKLTGNKDSATVFDSAKNDSEAKCSAAMQALKEYCDDFYKSVEEGKLIPVSDIGSKFRNLDVYTDCRLCDFKSVCRTSYSVSSHSLQKK